MNDEQRNALASVQFNWVLAPDDIWSPLHHHVDGLHPHAVNAITNTVRAVRRDKRLSPVGIALRGERGVGKTHMLGWLRQHMRDAGGWFFLLKILDGESFWAGAVHGVLNGLLNRDGGQLGAMLSELSRLAGCSGEVQMRLRGTIPVSRTDIDEFIERVRDLDPQVAMECQDTLRALVLYRARGKSSEVGHSYLVLKDGIGEEDRAHWGFRTHVRSPQLLLNDLSRIFALTGPVVMAVDQIDELINRPNEVAGRQQLVDRLAHGLMRLREECRRTILVVACIPNTWELIERHAVNSASDRFRVVDLKTAMPDAAVAAAIVAGHLSGLYGEVGFPPPYPTWPVSPEAFAGRDVVHLTPRRLLQLVDDHVRWCLANDTIRELTDLSAPAPRGSLAYTAEATDLDGFDERFDHLRREADVVTPLDHRHEDARMAALLGAVLRCYVLEQPVDGQDFAVESVPAVKPPLHALLRRDLDEAEDTQVRWAFRAIAHPNPRAALTRLQSACLEAELQAGSDKRHLIVLRNHPFSSGPRTTEALAAFEAAGGVALPIDQDDLRTFSALEEMLNDSSPEFLAWLSSRRPAGGTGLLKKILFPQVPTADAPPPPDRPSSPTEWPKVRGELPSVPVGSSEPVFHGFEPPATTHAPSDEPVVALGVDVENTKQFTLPLSLLRKHTAVFAGSGSGKTVLLRRLIEAVALHDVSSIVLDTNNDLARLGDPWPSPPAGWVAGDAERADRYLANTEVVVWTPRMESGRPLALNPLPDFGDVLDEPDELRISIEASVAGLLPRAGLAGRRVRTGTAVLIQALTYFARAGGTELREFVMLLADLPDGVSTIRDAVSLSAQMAEEFKAAMITDPVFGGGGERLDPGKLLTPSRGHRARVSVISCIGLPDEHQRQTFVNQLQLALFAWVKRNPAKDRPLGGLLVLDEAQTFVPSRGKTASTESTLRLAAQARKYGLGMVYATQAPKSLHNLVTGNSATQFFGHLNASAQIQAATELARAKGGQVDDIARLPTGKFYGATEGQKFAKLAMPMCLSHHPASALTEEEVLERARRLLSGE